jgi:hypothetical protein
MKQFRPPVPRESLSAAQVWKRQEFAARREAEKLREAQRRASRLMKREVL